MPGAQQQYLIQKAQAAGVNPLDLATVMHYESGLNPGRWGGKSGNYFGLIQFGPEERAKYGVDPNSPTFENQTDAALSFLRDRGYKPGMGLLDLYSTVNAGTPGRYTASDGNGTVSSHVAAMQPSREAATAWLGGDSVASAFAGPQGPPQQGQPLSNQPLNDNLGQIMAAAMAAPAQQVVAHGQPQPVQPQQAPPPRRTPSEVAQAILSGLSGPIPLAGVS